MNPLLAFPLTASLLAAVITTAGIAVIYRYESWGRANTVYFAHFAAGVLITASLLHIIPEALGKSPHAMGWVASGYFLMYGYNRLIKAYGPSCAETASIDYAIGLVPLLGIGLHSFMDGFIYSITFSASFLTGILAAVGMVFHEFPEGIVAYLFLREAGFAARKAILWSFLATALTTPLGMILSFPFIHDLEQPVLGNLLALSAGSLLYVGATHLLPHAERAHRKYSEGALALGVAVALVILLSRH